MQATRVDPALGQREMLAAIFKMTKPCCSTLLLLLLLSGAFPPKFLSAVSCRVLRLLTDPERADRLPTNKLHPPPHPTT